MPCRPQASVVYHSVQPRVPFGGLLATLVEKSSTSEEAVLRITIAQLAVTLDPADNLARMLGVLDRAHPGDWVAFPEGMLSGYAPEREDFRALLDAQKIADGIADIRRKAAGRGCYCVFGTATPTPSHDGWHNSVLIAAPDGRLLAHHKIELAALDRNHFLPGNSVSTAELGGLRFGIQACRELLFPLNWHSMKTAGAPIIFHINNAVQPQDAIWRHVIITRAVEFSIFVVSVNNCAPPQSLPSFLVSPAGSVILETACLHEEVLTAEIDPSEAICDLAARLDF